MKFLALNVDFNSLKFWPLTFKESFVRWHQIWVVFSKCVIIIQCTLIPVVAALSH